MQSSGLRLFLILTLLAGAGAMLWNTLTPSRDVAPTVEHTPPSQIQAPLGEVRPTQPVAADQPSLAAGPAPALGKLLDPVLPPAAPLIRAPATDEIAALDAALENVKFTLRDYRTVLGGNPIGNNREITGALLGDNLKQLKLPPPEGSTVNAAGELCDRWGTPYFFHQQSKEQMEIRSAGPDKAMWTADDRQL